MMMKPQHQKSFFSYLKKGIVWLLVSWVLLELLLYLFGYRPYRIHDRGPREMNGKKSVISDDLLGFRNNAGKYHFAFPSGTNFFVTHGESGTRIPNNAAKPYISFYGGSFTYGFGVSDTCTYPFYVGQSLDTIIRNCGCNGYGLQQAWLKMKGDFEKEIVPEYTVISYAYFHDERTTGAPSWQQELFSSGLVKENYVVQFPCIRSTNQMSVEYIRPKEQHSSLAKYSNVVTIIENYRMSVRSDEEKNQQIALNVLMQMDRLCKQHQSKLVVVGLLDDERTTETLKKLNEKGISTCQFTTDISKPKNNLSPDDGHPNPQAYRQYAKTFVNYLHSLAEK